MKRLRNSFMSKIMILEKKYKLFTFSNLRLKWLDLNKRNATFTFAKSPTTLDLSLYVDQAVQYFVLKKIQLSSGRFRADFEVSGIEMLPPPSFKIRYDLELKSPPVSVMISKKMSNFP
jgi:hypothetical protein